MTDMNDRPDDLRSDIEEASTGVRRLRAEVESHIRAATVDMPPDLEAILSSLESRAAEMDRLEKRLEAASDEVQLRQTQWREFVDFAPTGYLVTDAAGIILDTNHAAASHLGASRGYLAGKPLGVLIADEDRGRFYATICTIHRRAREELYELALRMQSAQRSTDRPLRVGSSRRRNG